MCSGSFFFLKTREDKFISNHLLNIYYMSETGNVDVYKPEKKKSLSSQGLYSYTVGNKDAI